MSDKPDLSALIGSRICHDLISPIGAIGNGVELLMADRGSASPELALIAESVASANARIRFFRVAYGVAGPDQRIARGEVTAILAAISQGSRLRLDWTSTTDLDRREVKLAFLLQQCVESAMPYGGRITILEAAGRWSIKGEAERLRFDPALWSMLADSTDAMPQQPDGPAQPIAAAQVQFALAAEALRQGPGSVKLDRGETLLNLRWNRPGQA